MRTVTEHLDRVLAAVTPTGDELVDVEGSSGRVLAEPVTATVDIPAFDNSAMDGYAVRFADLSRAGAGESLSVVGDLPAGASSDPSLHSGQAIRIMTGAPVPAAADTVVPFEDTAAGVVTDAASITVVRPPARRGAHVRRRGEDTRIGDIVLDAGTVLGPLQASAAVSAGAAVLRVARRPRVAVISTGDELVAPGAFRARGQIFDSNGPLIAALAVGDGAEVVLRARVGDSGPHLRELVAGLVGGADSAIDVVLFTGGVSAGAFEVVRNTFSADLEFVRVAMQPGKPQAFGTLGADTLAFGLPGNPVSAAVSYLTFVRPALRLMQGRPPASPPLRLTTSTGWSTPSGRRQYIPVIIDHGDGSIRTIRPASRGGSGSHLVGGLGRADAFAVVESDVEEVVAGDVLDVILIS